jgi:hypothetical protein
MIDRRFTSIHRNLPAIAHGLTPSAPQSFRGLTPLLVSAVFHYLGPSFAVLLFARVDVLGVA